LGLTDHGSEEQLELYVRGKLPQAQVVELEGHLLICSECLDRVEEAAQWTRAVQEALRDEPKAEPAVGWGFLQWPKSGFKSGLGMAAAGFAVLVLLVAGYWSVSRGRVVSVATLELAAVRGEMISVDPAGELDLILQDATVGAGPYRVRVVDAVGKSEWDATATTTGGSTEVRITKPLAAGTHFVRLYRPDGSMLHEYGFRVR
jgi:hypothetical protein